MATTLPATSANAFVMIPSPGPISTTTSFLPILLAETIDLTITLTFEEILSQAHPVVRHLEVLLSNSE